MKKSFRMWLVFLLILLVLALLGGFLKWRSSVTISNDNLETIDTEKPQDIPPIPSIEENIGSEEVLEEIKVGIVDMVVLQNQHPRMAEYKKLAVEITGYHAELSSQNEEYKLAHEQVKNQSLDLNTQLNAQLQGIRDKYQKIIDTRVQELQKELSLYEEETWKRALEDIERKKDDLQSLAQDMISKYHQKLETELKKYQDELDAEYAGRVINLRLKLQMIQLSEEEQEKYKADLEAIQIEQKQKLQEKSQSLEEEFNTFIENKQVELDTELKNYQNQLKEETETLFLRKQKELDKNLKDFITEKEEAMHKEFQERQTKIEENAKTSLLKTQTEIQQEMQKKEQRLRSKLEKAELEQVQILQQIDQDIRQIVGQLAHEEGYELVLTDIRVSVDVDDLTQLVLQKLKQ